ncbi:L-methionine/branched-chain amino acid transporter [Bowmanella yangjiangensis]|uniref:L-methionine/branched-chain amino acid transporter n=1 Tax=Bowmanella yangjiangensis TaxID=2811230 RepID=A0ABS3CRR5_9ALTE|nr:L-methionine/branched-chain amino acid transporter [Bowmanella yangjiangensis]MBN7819740.1 L-methionine/branched-chain amino acid transporter [Bowmanella yangjiangensis]
MSSKISRWQGAGLVATTLLGTGVFILPQLTLNSSGVDSVAVWLLLTLMIIPVALVMGKLAANYPHAGGPAHFVEQAFGVRLGQSLGLLFICVVPFGAPAAMLITFTFFSDLTGISGIWLLVCELLTLALLFLINQRGLKLSAVVQLGITLAVVALIVVLLAVPTAQVSATWQPSVPELETLLKGIGIAFWSFLGLEAITHLAEDFRHPQRDVMPAMVYGCLLVGGIYVATTLMLVLYPTAAKVAIMGIAKLKLGKAGVMLIGVLGVAGGLATVNVYLASLSRLVASFADKKVLPAALGQRNKHSMPTTAMTFILAINALMLLLTFVSNLDLEALITAANGVFVLIYMATMFAAWRLLAMKYRLLIGIGLLLLTGIMWSIGLQMIYAVLCFFSIYIGLEFKAHRTSAVKERP